jgi:uncharacterized phiE125 gp8 family phage protein
MTVRVVTEPSVEPITLAEARTHLVIDADFTADDPYITSLISVARRYAENITRRAYVQRTLELLLPNFSEYEFILPQPPLRSVSFIKYIDTDGVLQTVAAADYQVDTYREPGRIKPAYLESWPTIVRGDFNAVQIRYVAGYAESGSPASDLDYRVNVPEQLKQWMKVRVGMMYEMRLPVVVGTIVSDLKRDYVDGLLDSLVVDLF